jgi:hypothetical protein
MKFGMTCAGMTIAMAICALSMAADIPATQPSAPAKGPKEQLIEWQKTFASMDVDTAMPAYHTESDAEVALARVIADWAITESKVQGAVRDKWGAAVESAFAHVNDTDTMEDDQSSTVEIDGDRATISFKSTTIDPLPMILVDGQWRMDVHAMSQKLGKDVAATEKYDYQATSLLNDAAKDIASEKYPNAAAFLNDFQQKMDKLSVDNN